MGRQLLFELIPCEGQSRLFLSPEYGLSQPVLVTPDQYKSSGLTGWLLPDEHYRNERFSGPPAWEWSLPMLCCRREYPPICSPYAEWYWREPKFTRSDADSSRSHSCTAEAVIRDTVAVRSGSCIACFNGQLCIGKICLVRQPVLRLVSPCSRRVCSRMKIDYRVDSQFLWLALHTSLARFSMLSRITSI